MTPADFAANLRAEMGRQGWCGPGHAFRVFPKELRAYGEDFWFSRLLPDPDQLADIATALGCPVERLTVSREELEAELAFRKVEVSDLTAEVERLRSELKKADTWGKLAADRAAEIAHLRAENERLREEFARAKGEAAEPECEDCIELGHETGRPNPKCRRCREATP